MNYHKVVLLLEAGSTNTEVIRSNMQIKPPLDSGFFSEDMFQDDD